MIIGFTGTPGSGKSYDAVRKILDNLSMGRVVFTNIDGMDTPECLEMIKNVCDLSDLALFKQLIFLQPDQLEDFWNHVSPGSLVVLDEVQKIFSSREWQTEKNKKFGFWCSTHRHHGFDLVLITQDAARIDSAVRSLFEWCYIYRKVNFFGALVKQKYLRYAYAGDSTSGPALKKLVRTYSSKVFRCYQSYVSKDIKEQGIMNHVNVLKHPVFMILPIVLFFTLYLFFGKSSFSKGDLFGGQAALQAKSEVTRPVNQTASADPHRPAEASHTPSINRILDGSRLVLSNRRNAHGP
jgi:zona occludens toxin (predicted ATPase)